MSCLSCLDSGPQWADYVPGGEGSDFADCNPESLAEARRGYRDTSERSAGR